MTDKREARWSVKRLLQESIQARGDEGLSPGSGEGERKPSQNPVTNGK